MTAAHETAPYSGEPDEFDLLICELAEQIEDPYLAGIHKQARECEELLQLEGADTNDFSYAKAQYEKYLNEQWRFTGQKVLVTGKVWKSVPGTSAMVPEDCVAQPATSYGFLFYTDPSVTDGPERIKAAHCLELQAGETVVPVAACLDDLIHLELPETTKELREHRFNYYFPDQAAAIRDLTDTRRNDQILKNFGSFYMDLNFDNERDIEHAKDCAQYLRSRAEIEPEANYRLTILGEIIGVDGSGAGYPSTIEKISTCTAKINDIAFRPLDVYLKKFKGWQFCAPFIDITAFRQNGTDRHMLVPLNSVVSMYSLRYRGLPEPIESTITVRNKEGE